MGQQQHMPNQWGNHLMMPGQSQMQPFGGMPRPGQFHQPGMGMGQQPPPMGNMMPPPPMVMPGQPFRPPPFMVPPPQQQFGMPGQPAPPLVQQQPISNQAQAD